ncbi:2Fe-2S iron-sulfur cluster-binding protein [Streptomyces sp. NPDC127084]|uniref:2Fe-2S iron-sulfur cluster-binding protein n=1 Tax=Streptomyces sp. NPDC127084 TaxID=3347133 RepID=UPI00365B50C9
MKHPLAELYDGHDEIQAEIDRRFATQSVQEAPAGTVEGHHPKRLRLVVGGIRVETASTRTFRLRREDGQPLPPFLAGQYVNVFADGTSRPYAIASSPSTHAEYYELTARRVPEGRISNLLIDTLAVGDRLTTTGPMGTFHHNPLFHGDDLVFLAGGSGVVPAMSMLREIADQGQDSSRRVHLVYGSRDVEDVIFHDELAALAAANPARIRVDHVIGGLLTAVTISELTGPLNGRMVYVCGPQAMYPYVLGQLASLGHPRRRIRFEANGAPARPEAQPHWPAGTDGTEEVTVTACGTRFRTPRNRPLLDALEDHGIRPEAACRSGECGMCVVRVVSGETHTAEEARLRMADERFGYTHSCVAYPLTDVEIEI